MCIRDSTKTDFTREYNNLPSYHYVTKYYGDLNTLKQAFNIKEKIIWNRETIKEALEKKGIDKFLISEVTFVPNNYISLDEETTEKVTNLIDALTDLDDVQAVYHNLEI